MAHGLVDELPCSSTGFVDQTHCLRICGRGTVGVQSTVQEQERPVHKPLGMRLRGVLRAERIGPCSFLGLPTPFVRLVQARSADD